jgi:ABC-2 type transport system ATP-binding protein
VSAVERKPAQLVAQPLVVEHQSSDLVAELSALPLALQAASRLALVFSRCRPRRPDRVGRSTVGRHMAHRRGLAGSVRGMPCCPTQVSGRGVREAVRLFASFYPNPLDPDQLLESLGVKQIANSSFKSLSGGQKHRLSIALALVGNPRLAILDELTTGLDPEARREIWSLIERMRDRGVTVILVTHFMDEAERLCDRLALINHGTVTALDTPEAIAAQAGGSRVRFVPSQPVDDQTLRAIRGVNEIERKERYVTVTGTGDLAGSLINALAAIGVRVSDVEARTGNLEDAFIKLTKDDASTVGKEVQR